VFIRTDHRLRWPFTLVGLRPTPYPKPGRLPRSVLSHASPLGEARRRLGHNFARLRYPDGSLVVLDDLYVPYRPAPLTVGAPLAQRERLLA
jgi:hypothetical protein